VGLVQSATGEFEAALDSFAKAIDERDARLPIFIQAEPADRPICYAARLFICAPVPIRPMVNVDAPVPGHHQQITGDAKWLYGNGVLVNLQITPRLFPLRRFGTSMPAHYRSECVALPISYKGLVSCPKASQLRFAWPVGRRFTVRPRCWR
jgi:hypothetical protein